MSRLLIALFFISSSVCLSDDDDAAHCKPSYVVAPPYPILAFQARVSGEVTMELQVSEAGRVEGVNRFDGDKIFRVASENTARSWQYVPLPGPGRRCTVSLAYKIMPKGTCAEFLTSRFTPPAHVEVRRQTAEPSITVDPAPAHPSERTKSGQSPSKGN